MTLILKYWKKIVFAVVVLAVLIYFYYFNGEKTKIYDFSSDHTAPTLSEFEAESIAALIFEAMGSYGTDEKTIEKYLTGIERNNYIMISNAFGLKPYDGILGTLGSTWLGMPAVNLTAWLKAELSNSQFKALNLPV